MQAPDQQHGWRMPETGETSTEVGEMPKEVIGDQYAYRGDSENHHPPLQVEVSWGREWNDVQIGTTNPAVGKAHDPERGWFAHLDRNGVNRLIRALRKARDQAFGADA